MPPLHYSAISRIVFPLLVCIAYTVIVEQVLYRRNMIYLPLWRPTVMSVLIGVAVFIWHSWAQMTPMESVLLYGGSDAMSLKTSVALFAIVVAAAILALAWSSVQRMVVDRSRGASSYQVLLLRISTLLPPLVTAIAMAVRCNAMIGAKGFLALALG
ncbi:MAG: hypothetical protein IJS46_02945 [Kiritimatiellae bacterium]|nr:hypothetical protein [Kiritimatiellia bacterium]